MQQGVQVFIVKQAERNGKELAEKKAIAKLKNQLEHMAQEIRNADHMVKMMKQDYEKKLAKKDKQIQELTKELDKADAEMKRMQKALFGVNNGL